MTADDDDRQKLDQFGRKILVPLTPEMLGFKSAVTAERPTPETERAFAAWLRCGLTMSQQISAAKRFAAEQERERDEAREQVDRVQHTATRAIESRDAADKRIAELEKEVKGYRAHAASIDEALNMDNGSYKP